ncbi:aminodeoxychorismate synthase component I [Paraburkholderia sp. D1E]|uniref:aminodeoxychorismate synthase component I n=1 Tax=Paraburkholderia sp. D1E TaxID=3461398 RepID=UPI0040464635
MSFFQVQVRVLNDCPDALATFERLFAHSSSRFLLESSVVVPGFSRFSFMGDAHGPLGEQITYDVRTQEATIEQNGFTKTVRVPSLFDLLKANLAERKIACDVDLPFGFDLGYAGVFGYELKGETIGTRAYDSAAHDAAFIFATRLVVLDHLERKTYLLFLTEHGDEAARRDAVQWFDADEREVRELLSADLAVTPAASTPTDAVVRKRLSLKEVEQWIAGNAQMRHDRSAYIGKIEEALQEIVHGESYEICLTNLITFPFEHSPFELYRAMHELTPAPHAAYFSVGDFYLVSSSPERFLSVDRHGYAEAKPIKGTRPRGRTPSEDADYVEDLHSSEKDRAENLMIVDLLRNDLGQVCMLGSVQVPKLFDVETYSHVHQLVSTVRGRLKDAVATVDCVRAVFPGGSMTGAPKKRTMEIIDRLEEGPRGIYSGALGWFGLSGACDFSIVIRSVLIDHGQAQLGVGGAITALSDPAEEFDETIVKARGVVEAVEHVRAAERRALHSAAAQVGETFA